MRGGGAAPLAAARGRTRRASQRPQPRGRCETSGKSQPLQPECRSARHIVNLDVAYSQTAQMSILPGCTGQDSALRRKNNGSTRNYRRTGAPLDRPESFRSGVHAGQQLQIRFAAHAGGGGVAGRCESASARDIPPFRPLPTSAGLPRAQPGSAHLSGGHQPLILVQLSLL